VRRIEQWRKGVRPHGSVLLRTLVILGLLITRTQPSPILHDLRPIDPALLSPGSYIPEVWVIGAGPLLLWQLRDFNKGRHGRDPLEQNRMAGW